jgi:hypothetical protein
LRENSISLASKPEEAIIADYLEKYASIADRAISPQLISIFAEALSDMPLNRIKQGLERYLKEGERFPWPSHIRELGEL